MSDGRESEDYFGDGRTFVAALVQLLHERDTLQATLTRVERERDRLQADLQAMKDYYQYCS